MTPDKFIIEVDLKNVDIELLVDNPDQFINQKCHANKLKLTLNRYQAGMVVRAYTERKYRHVDFSKIPSHLTL